MSTSSRVLFAPLLAMLLAGCDSDTNFSSGSSAPPPAPPAASGTVVVLHASSDAPAVNVLFNGTERISNLPYKAISTLRLAAGDQAVRVDGRLPGGAIATVIPAAGPDPVVPVADGDQVSIIALGDVAGITAQVVVDSDPVVPAGEVRLRVLHAAPAVGPVQVWLSEPNAALDAADPAVITAGFAFNSFLTPDPLQIPSGSYRVRVTPSLADTTVLYDSGPARPGPDRLRRGCESGGPWFRAGNHRSAQSGTGWRRLSVCGGIPQCRSGESDRSVAAR